MIKDPCEREHIPEPQVLAWLQIVRTYHKMQRRMQFILNKHHVTLAQMDVIASLHFHPCIPQQALAERLLVTKGNISGLIDRLAERGLVERRDDPEDRRTNHICLTESGEALMERATPEHNALVGETMAALTVEEQQTLVRLLEKMESGL